MKIRTHLGNTIDGVDSLKARYDKNVKEILADIQVLARIVKHTVVEVENLSIQEIMRCIDRESIRIGTAPIAPGLSSLNKVESIQTEDSIPNESYVTYDIRFMLVIAAAALEIIINVEAQKTSDFKKLGYHLESRIVFYLARLISSQKGLNFEKSEYDNIKKVYSIWICMDADDEGDSVSRIYLKSDTVFGKQRDFPKLDKMCGIVVRIRDNDDVVESQNKLIAMLEDVLSSEDSETKKRKLTEKYEMQVTTELEGRFNSMYNLSDVVEDRGIKKGIERGMEQGIKGLVDILKDMGTPDEIIVEKIMEKFSLSVEEAEKYVK